MELTFVNAYSDSAPKRRRLAKACESCRLRKKRCIHHAARTEKVTITRVDDPVDDDDADEDAITHTGNSTPQIKGTPEVHQASKAEGSRHFISDLNPEATFLQRPQRSSEPPKRQQNDDIGIWVDKREWDALLRQKNNLADSSGAQDPPRVNQRPHSTVIGPLVDIYFRKINPILPLLDEATFRRNYVGGIVPEPLAHAVCLVAAKDTEAASHLLLHESDAALTPRDFCSRLHASVIGTLRTPDLLEKTTLIQILALASLHPEGQDGAEDATMCLNKAMHYCQTLGWHLGQQPGIASGDDLTTKRLFWCLWSLDRMNSCLYGRPIMMSDEDIAIEPFERGESGFPAFEVWLFISRMLNKIIGFYRPGRPLDLTGWEYEHFPSFEEALDEGQAWGQPQAVLATLHLYYLLTAVLAHRSRGVKYMPRSTPSYVRQSLCSTEIVRLMSSHLLDSLQPLPILPYAISLALSVAYQRIRQSQLQHQQEDARDDFKTCCQVLQKLRRCWSSADVIGVISKKVLDELNKAVDLSSFRVGRLNESNPQSPGICTASLVRPHTIIDTRDTANGNANNNAAAHDVDRATSAPHTQNGFEVFEGMDDLFSTYMDPNYPVNLDDLTLLDETVPLDWNVISS